ncbi:MAG: glycosyltransferase, partial [Rubellimicrobium sp.]|nr:glycosyltransferase [Rubellimicrobium sp.]
PQLRACRRLAAASPHAGRVRFHGALPQAEVQRHLARAAIFVLPAQTGRDGETEGLPSAIQEAMAAGAAILSTRHAGIPELVAEGESGHLVDEGDAAGLAAAMARMLADPGTVAAMGRAARRIAEERVDHRRLYHRVEMVMAEAISAARGAARTAGRPA